MRKLALIGLVLLAATTCHAVPLPQISHSHVNGNIVASTVAYTTVGDAVISHFFTEAWAQIPIYSSGTYCGLKVKNEVNSITSPSTYTFRVNGADGNQTVVLPAGVLVGTDTTHCDHINVGDKVDIKTVSGSGGSFLTPLSYELMFTPDDPTVNYQSFNPTAVPAGQIITNGFQPYYSNITGYLGQNFFENHTYHVMRASTTFKNLGVYVASNARAVTAGFYLRKNGVTTPLSISVAGGVTGLIQNTTTTVFAVIGDTVDIGMDMGGSGSDANPLNFSFIRMEALSTTGQPIEYAAGNDDKPQNAGETWTMPFISALDFGGDEYLIQAGSSGTLSNFCMYVGQNNVSTTSTLKFRVNAITNPNMVITIPPSGTGTFCDNTHSITFVSTDTLGYLGNSPAGTGTLYYSSFGAKFVPAYVTGRTPSDPLPVGYRMFPSTNVWYTDISQAVVSSSNTSWMDGNNGHSFHDLHPDFGTNFVDGSYNGIPYNLVYSATDPKQTIPLGTYASESDTQPVGGIPIPINAIAEQDIAGTRTTINGDQHMILVDMSTNFIYEMFTATRTTAGGTNWRAAQFTQWDTASNVLRADNITSADAGGLPLFVGLIRPDEIQAGVINHAIRFTLSLTNGPHMWPARHDANTGSAVNPPFGMRVRMKASVNLSGFTGPSLIIFTAMKKHGMILADNGGDWYVSGAPSATWNDTQLHNDFITVGFPHDIFEVVDESTWAINPLTSAEALNPLAATTAAATKELLQRRVTINGNVKLK